MMRRGILDDNGKDVIREGHPNLNKVSEPVKVPLQNEDKKLLGGF